MLNFSSLFAQNVVVTATRGATSDDKLGIMTSHGFQCCPPGMTRGLVHRIVVFIEYITVTSCCPRDAVSNHQPHDCVLTIYSSVDQRKHQSSASLAFVGGIHRSPVNSPHKGPVTRKMFPFDDVIMISPAFIFFSRLRSTGEWVGDQQERGQHYGKKCRRCHLRWLDVLAFWIRTQFWYRTRMEQCLLWLGAFPDHYK